MGKSLKVTYYFIFAILFLIADVVYGTLILVYLLILSKLVFWRKFWNFFTSPKIAV